jgi:hypothetical protein
MDRSKPTWQIVVECLLILGVNLASVWAILPEDQKMWLRLRWADSSRRVLGALAAREGRAGMADELRGGSEAAGVPRYAAGVLAVVGA